MAKPLIRHVEVRNIEAGVPIESTQGALIARLRGTEPKLAVIKPQNNLSNLRLCPNELICNLLGRLIEAPLLEPLLVNLPSEVLAQNDLLKKYRGIKSGLCYGTSYEPTAGNEQMLSSNFINLTNQEQAIPTLLLDTWVHNLYHVYDINLIFTENNLASNYSQKMYAIDYGLAFGEDWTADSLVLDKFNINMGEHKFAFILSKLAQKHKDKLEYYLERVITVTEDDLTSIFETLPSEWNIDYNEQEALLDFLLYRQKQLPELFRKYFNE